MLFIFVIANIITTSHAQRPTRCFLNHLHSLYLCTYSSILGAYKSRIHQIRVKKYNKNSYIRTLIVSSEKKGRERVAVICFDYILFELCLCFFVVRKIWREANEEVFAQNAGYFLSHFISNGRKHKWSCHWRTIHENHEIPSKTIIFHSKTQLK